MEPLLCFPDPPPPPVVAALQRAGYPWRALDRPGLAGSPEPEDGWGGAGGWAQGDLAAAAFAPGRARPSRGGSLRPLEGFPPPPVAPPGPNGSKDERILPGPG